MNRDDVNRWIDLHGHDSPKVANLVTREASEDELVHYVHLALNLMDEDEAVEVIDTIHDCSTWEGDQQ